MCVGRNYAEHAAETGSPAPTEPQLFAKWANAVIGSGEPIVYPSITRALDYEAELTVVIGRRAKSVPEDDTTAHMLFTVAEIVAFTAQAITLEPGDVLMTGTPPGVGFARDPQVFMHPGDVVRVEIDGIGALENPVVAPG